MRAIQTALQLQVAFPPFSFHLVGVLNLKLNKPVRQNFDRIRAKEKQ